MAVYVTSDIHGHLRALDRVLEMAQPGGRGTVWSSWAIWSTAGPTRSAS